MCGNEILLYNSLTVIKNEEIVFDSDFRKYFLILTK